jgi:hypothetical protein
VTHASITRQQIAQSVVDRFIFQDLRLGVCDCAHLAASVLDASRIKHPLSRARYTTLRGAKRALKAAGASDLAQALDKIGLERIPPASALPGDLIAVEADSAEVLGGWTLGVALGANKLIAFIAHNGRTFADTGNLTELCVYAADAGLQVVAWRVG